MATNFEAFTHQQLKAMSDALDPKTVKARAEQLKKAADDIAKIAEKLKKHQVTGWEGEGAVAFQEWVGRAGNATLRLSEYSAHGSHWMTQAVQKMYEAQTMPAYDTDAAANLAAARKYHNDPDSRTIGPQAQSKLNTDHTEAVQLMKKLAEAYELSSTEMNKAEAPTFPPPPDVLVPSGYDSGVDMARPGGGGGIQGGSSNSVFTPHASSGGPGGGPSDAPASTSGSSLREGHTSPTPAAPVPNPTPWVPDRDVNVDLDSVATLPPTTVPPTLGTPSPLPTGGSVNPGGGFVPPLALSPIGGTMAHGRPGSGGIGNLPGVSGPAAFGGGKVGGVGGFPGMPPRDSGIVGGRPVASGGPSAGIPRGTVIGAEGTQAGRAMGGMGGGMGGGLGGGHGAAAGSAAGRRLAMEQGGVVGGRPTGAAGRPTTGGQPFTPGGSGLVRNANGATGSGAVGHAGAGARTAGKRREDQTGERPDYLAEDEETWQGNRRVVPPVID
ncbi:WXG100 family type VII secretion target [Streptomyces sp. NPDC058701]|uniref:WXG100 family type VII secretion target n=1 Tax=Streptomyces sp. NPDC058701 TaxID=3346608 RepID=UPI003669C41C